MPEVYLKLWRFLQLNRSLTEAILFGFFLILSEARRITRYCLQQHKSCGKHPSEIQGKVHKTMVSYDDKKSHKLLFISNYPSL